MRRGIVFFSLCISLYSYGLEKAIIPSKKITILIHGTRMMRSFPFSLSSSLKTFDANLSTPLMGLHHYTEVHEANNQVTIAKILHKTSPILFPLETFYFYGWSGQLSLSERRKEAKNLALQIQSLIVEPYKTKYGITPEITIITHSHGGNLVLNLAREKNLPFSIDTLIMLACPVQHETTKFIISPVFKTIYSLYSHNDILQVLDPQFIGTINHGVIKAFTKKSTSPLKRMWGKINMAFLFITSFYQNSITLSNKYGLETTSSMV